MGTFASWQEIVNAENLSLKRQAVENYTLTNILELLQRLNDKSDTFLQLVEVDELNGFHSVELENKKRKLVTVNVPEV